MYVLFIRRPKFAHQNRRLTIKMSKWESNEEIRIFREYLRIPSVQPNVNYDECVKFLREQAKNLDLPVRIYYPADPKKPIVVITWDGLQPELPSILLNSHMDVVPVFEEYWTHPPFAADIDDEGKIFARGAQDMKSIGTQYLAAIRALKREGIRLKRTVHVMFVPDEETGGDLGMKAFVPTDDFKTLNVAFALDEGRVSPNDQIQVSYAERSVWWFYFKISGTTGHGSLLLPNTVGEKVEYIINKLNEFRSNEVAKLANSPELSVGDVTSVNLTMLSGGVQINVIPPEATLGFDIRLAIDMDHEAFEEQLNRWCAEAGGGIRIEYDHKEPKIAPTKIDATNPFWTAFKTTLVDDLKLAIKTKIFPGGSDCRYIRQAGIPALGFAPTTNTPQLLHDNDEFLKADSYLAGIDIYQKLITKLANV